jgi:hypothetical protein
MVELREAPPAIKDGLERALVSEALLVPELLREDLHGPNQEVALDRETP